MRRQMTVQCMIMQAIFTSRTTFYAFTYLTNVFSAFILFPTSKYRASDISHGNEMKSCEIHKNTLNTLKFARNLITYMPIQHIWNLSWQLGLLITCRKLANLSRKFITTTSKQRPRTTTRKLCCEKLGTSHDVKSFANGSGKIANDYLFRKT